MGASESKGSGRRESLKGRALRSMRHDHKSVTVSKSVVEIPRIAMAAFDLPTCATLHSGPAVEFRHRYRSFYGQDYFPLDASRI